MRRGQTSVGRWHCCVTVVSPLCHRCVTLASLQRHSCVTVASLLCHPSVTLASLMRHRCVTLVSLSSVTVVSPLCHCCVTVASLQRHSCVSLASLLCHCCVLLFTSVLISIQVFARLRGVFAFSPIGAGNYQLHKDDSFSLTVLKL